MKKAIWRPGNMLYPVPSVMVSCGTYENPGDETNCNVLTVAWTGTICSDPAMVYISVRPSRHSHALIKKAGEFVINLTSTKLARAMDYCGVRSGRDHNKFKEMKLTLQKAETVKAPLIAESPVNIECKVTQILPLGSHDMFLAEVTAVRVNEDLLDETGRLMLEKAGLIAYSHGTYYELGKALGKFGYSVQKKQPRNAKTAVSSAVSKKHYHPKGGNRK